MTLLIVLLPLLTALVQAIALDGSKSQFSWQSTKALLAFGDSYTFVQGSAGLPAYSFIADAFTQDLISQELLNDTITANTTSAGGPNWVEYLTGCGFQTQKPVDCNGKGQKQLWDFAFAGADVSTRYLPLHHNYSVDLDTQISSFASQAFSLLPVRPKQTLVTVFIGINDVSDSSKNTTISSFPDFYERIISTAFDSVTTLYRLGYRDYLFLNLPPLEHTPGNVIAAASNKTLSPTVEQVASWNEELVSASTLFSKKYPDSHVMLFDTHTYLDKIWHDPTPYGIVNTTGYCASYAAPDIATNYTAYGCLPIFEYFWYNTGHITYHVHQLLADGVRQFLARGGK